MKAYFICDSECNVRKVYGEETVKALRNRFTFDGNVYGKSDVLSGKCLDAEYIFSTWGMPSFTREEIRKFLPDANAVFYGAGSVQGFAREFLAEGVKVFSAWGANAVPVAEFTVSEILLANKGFFKSAPLASSGKRGESYAVTGHFPGNFNAKIGIIGAGMVGKRVIEILSGYHLKVFVYDPFLPDEAAEKLGVKKESLDFIFSECNVISNHTANNEQTKGMFTYSLFSKMRPYSTFINTGRGAQVIEDDLIRTLTERPDITALLDVTDPEPPMEKSPFYTLPNCIITPHIAGSLGNECERMGEYMMNEAFAFGKDEETKYEVTEKMLATMA